MEAAATVVTAPVQQAVVSKATVGGMLSALGNVPLSAIIRIGVFAGLAIFTAWVMIRRTKKIHKQTEAMESPYAVFDGNTTIAEDILHNQNYVGNATIFSELDPIAQQIAADLDPAAGKRKSQKGKKKKRKPEALKTRKDLREENEELAGALRAMLRSDRRGLKREWGNFGKSMRDSGLKEIDEIAKRMGLTVDPYAPDDEIPADVLEKYGDILL